METWVVVTDFGRWDDARTEVNSVHTSEKSANQMASKLNEEYQNADKSTIQGCDQPQFYRVEGPFDAIED